VPFSQISSVILFSLHINILFSLHINMPNCYTQCTATGCELNGNITVTVRWLLQCAVFSDQFSYCILPAHQQVELLHTVYSDRLRTEWKYNCNCTVTATVRSSHNCTDTALGEFFHLQCGFHLHKHIPILQIETNIYVQTIKLKRYLIILLYTTKIQI